MRDVEELERSLLEGARKELAPSASDRMRIQSRLVANPAWFVPAQPLRPSLLRSLARSWRGGLALGFVMGALLGFGAARGVEQAWRQSPVPVDVATKVAVPALALPALAVPALAVPVVPALSEEPVGNALEQGAASAEELAPRAAPSLPDRSNSVSRARAAARPARGPELEESGSTLARELALLQRARRALNRNDALLALGIVQSLDERFPNGVLLEERVATRILSLCQLDRAEEARGQALHFLNEHPRSVYAERVRRSCAGGR